MRPPQYRHRARQVQDRTLTILRQQLAPRDFSKKCTALTLLTVLLLAACHRASLAHAAALAPDGTPGYETLRLALHRTLPGYDDLRRRLRRLLAASLPRGLTRRKRLRRRYPLAIDLHAVPYFVRDRTPPPQVRRDQKKPGTHHGHVYATAMVLRRGQYYTVALAPYLPGDSLAELVKGLLRQARDNGFAPRYVLLDRGFWSVAVLRYLQQARTPFLLPVIARGKRPDAPGGPTGTWAFFAGHQTGHSTYTLQDRKRQKATVRITVQRRNHAGRQGKHGRYAWVYAWWGLELHRVAWVRQKYRRRFAIESSYRQAGQARARTSSRDAKWRLLLVVIAVLLRNVWLTACRDRSRGAGGPPGREFLNRLVAQLGAVLLGQLERQAGLQRNPHDSTELAT